MEEVLQNFGVGLRPINDPFFEDSYSACKIFRRKGITVEDDEELCHEVMKQFSCYVASCKATFNSLLDFEMHYNTTHRYVCTECKKPMPNPRLLEIHIQETHDSFFEVMSAKQPMYLCYVSECDLKFNDSIERRNHCINVHKFPKKFKFNNVSHYKKVHPENEMEVEVMDNKRSKKKKEQVQLNKNQKTRMFTATAAVFQNPSKAPIESNNSHTNVQPSSLLFIPRQVQKSYTKALTNNQSSERNVLESDTLMDLAESLPQ